MLLQYYFSWTTDQPSLHPFKKLSLGGDSRKFGPSLIYDFFYIYIFLGGWGVLFRKHASRCMPKHRCWTCFLLKLFIIFLSTTNEYWVKSRPYLKFKYLIEKCSNVKPLSNLSMILISLKPLIGFCLSWLWFLTLCVTWSLLFLNY